MLFSLDRFLFGHTPWRARKKLLSPTIRIWHGKPLLVLPGVFDPRATIAGEWLADQTSKLVKPGEHWLDVGTGTGIVALAMAEAGAQVTATDIDPDALRCARTNSLLRRTPITVIEADLFPPPPSRFDGICANLPFWPGEPDGSFYARAMRAGSDFSLLKRFRTGLFQVAPKAFLVISEQGGDATRALTALGQPKVVSRERFRGETMVLLELSQP